MQFNLYSPWGESSLSEERVIAVGTAVAGRPRPIDGATREPLPRPDPDFHERVSLLGDHAGVVVPGPQLEKHGLPGLVETLLAQQAAGQGVTFKVSIAGAFHRFAQA